MNNIPDETMRAFARTIVREAQQYGFGSIDIIRLIGVIMDLTSSADVLVPSEFPHKPIDRDGLAVEEFPLRSERIQIRRADASKDLAMLEQWVEGKYGAYFLLSSATAQQLELSKVLSNAANEIGIVEVDRGRSIGAVAFLDIDQVQRKAELRKLIGVSEERGKGYAEEATALWIEYGRKQLGLEKIYLSTLQTHLRNIKLNEAVGFRVEGVLRGELRLRNSRHDVLRMGLCFEQSAT